MFCTTLRRRKSFSTAIPALTANPGLNLREDRLDTHDLAIPLPCQGSADTTRTLRTLLLSPTCTAPCALPTTLARIQHFAALNCGIDSMIIFLLNSDTPTTHMNTSQPDNHQQQQQQQQQPTSGLHAYTHLSANLLTDPSLSSIPLLPLASTSALEPLLKTYIRTNSAGRAARQVQERRHPDDAFNTAFDLLPQCTAAGAAVAPLSRDALFRLTDLFGSLRELSDVAVRHEQGDERVSGKVKRMMGLLGEQTTNDVLEFWVDEWVAD